MNHSDKGEILNSDLIKSYMFQMLCVSYRPLVGAISQYYLGAMFLPFSAGGSPRSETTKSSY